MPPRLSFEKVKFTTASTVLSDKKTVQFHASMPFYNKKEPLRITIEAPKSSYVDVMDVFDTLSYESVQRRFLKDNKINAETINAIQGIMINNEINSDGRGQDVVIQENMVKLAFTKAQFLCGDGLAWYDSGGADKGFMYPWAIKQFLDMGLYPDFVYAVSTAAFFLSPFCKNGDIDGIIANVKQDIRTMNWHWYVDPDVKGALTDLESTRVRSKAMT